jgi:hypothetical protein
MAEVSAMRQAMVSGGKRYQVWFKILQSLRQYREYFTRRHLPLCRTSAAKSRSSHGHG